MKVLFLNDMNKNEFIDPRADLVEIISIPVTYSGMRVLEEAQVGVERHGGSWKDIMTDGDIKYNHIKSGKLSDFEEREYDVKYKLISGNY